jgi:hypothetical protein
LTAGNDIDEYSNLSYLVTTKSGFPIEPRSGAKFCAFPAFWQDGRVAWEAAVTVSSPNDLAVFPGITHSSRRARGWTPKTSPWQRLTHGGPFVGDHLLHRRESARI